MNWWYAVGGLFVGLVVVWWVFQPRRSSHYKNEKTPFGVSDHGPVPAVPRDYSAKNVGNDASARPWERSLLSEPEFDSATEGGQGGLDVEAFIATSKANFVLLQKAWDQGNVPALRALMTEDMLGNIQTQLAAREQAAQQSANTTEVAMLEAKLLDVEETSDEYFASVEFSGMLREESSAGPSPFREVWSIRRAKQPGSPGWLVAGVQALQ